MDLRDITMDDLPLYEGMLTDSRMMSELGGPLATDGLKEKLQGIVDDVQTGKVWFSVIVPGDDPDVSAGHVCIWDHDEDEQTINEIGWMVRTESQGHGLASEAVRSILDRTRAERRWGVIHAYPGLTNGASNAICRKAGFTNVGERDIEYSGRALRCNDWVIDLRTIG